MNIMSLKKLTRKLLCILFIFILFSTNISKAEINERKDYEKTYNSLPALDLYFDSREDVQEIFDCQDYYQSPYPLFRTSLTLKYKDLTFKPGYYLLTPRNYSNYEFVMFKVKGKIVGFVPVYEKTRINFKEVYKEPPKPKDALYKRPFVAMKKGFKKVFKRYLKPPEPYKHKIETKVTDDGKYFLVWLYVKDNLYKMVFKFKKH